MKCQECELGEVVIVLVEVKKRIFTLNEDSTQGPEDWAECTSMTYAECGFCGVRSRINVDTGEVDFDDQVDDDDVLDELDLAGK